MKTQLPAVVFKMLETNKTDFILILSCLLVKNNLFIPVFFLSKIFFFLYLSHMNKQSITIMMTKTFSIGSAI